MATMFKRSAKEKWVKHAMEYHKIDRKEAIKLVRALEMIEEVKLTKRIDEVFSKPQTQSPEKSQRDDSGCIKPKPPSQFTGG